MMSIPSLSVLITKNKVDETLAVLPTEGKHSLDPLSSFAKDHGVPLSIVEDMNVVGGPEAHLDEADLWLCLEGEVIFTLGGEIIDRHVRNKNGVVNEREIRGSGIVGGKDVVLKKGDWLWISAGEPHSHRATGVARLAIVKVPVKK